jgi:hypothetical protein
MIVPTSDIADVAGAGATAPTAGGPAEVAGVCTVGSSADAGAVSAKRAGIVVGPVFAENAELAVAVPMLILTPSLCSTYHPEYLMLRMCVVTPWFMRPARCPAESAFRAIHPSQLSVSLPV